MYIFELWCNIYYNLTCKTEFDFALSPFFFHKCRRKTFPEVFSNPEENPTSVIKVARTHNFSTMPILNKIAPQSVIAKPVIDS